MTEGVSNRPSCQETFEHNVPQQVSDTQSWRSGQERGRGSGRGRGRRRRRGRGKGNPYTGRGYYVPSFQCEGMTLYTKNDYSREDYSKLSTNQKDAIRLVRLKQPNKSEVASTISEVISALTSGFTNVQETVVQGVRNASTNNDNSATSTKRNRTVTPTQ